MPKATEEVSVPVKVRVLETVATFPFAIVRPPPKATVMLSDPVKVRVLDAVSVLPLATETDPAPMIRVLMSELANRKFDPPRAIRI